MKNSIISALALLCFAGLNGCSSLRSQVAAEKVAGLAPSNTVQRLPTNSRFEDEYTIAPEAVVSVLTGTWQSPCQPGASKEATSSLKRVVFHENRYSTEQRTFRDRFCQELVSYRVTANIIFELASGNRPYFLTLDRSQSISLESTTDQEFPPCPLEPGFRCKPGTSTAATSNNLILWIEGGNLFTAPKNKFVNGPKQQCENTMKTSFGEWCSRYEKVP